MGMIDLLLGRKAAAAAKPRNSRPPATTQFDSQHTQGGSNPQSVRKDLLRMALRDTLTRNGIPPTWLSADLLRTSSARKEAGLHVRFLVRHWEPRLLTHGLALEQDFAHRLQLLDPAARTWVTGFSWQFALEDASLCPPLPHPNTWTAPAPPSQPAALATEPAPLPSADVIEGPTVLPSPADVRADLERLMALRDADLRRHAGAGDQAYAPTRPATL
jgi:hypothetical protein